MMSPIKSKNLFKATFITEILKNVSSEKIQNKDNPKTSPLAIILVGLSIRLSTPL